MTLFEAEMFLINHGATPEVDFASGTIVDDDVYGVEFSNGSWVTYYCDRGNKTHQKKWTSEEEAAEFMVNAVKLRLEYLGKWVD